jgi:hypothetical protein
MEADPNVKTMSWVARKCMLFGLAFVVVGLSFLLAFLVATTPAAWATPGNVATLVGAFILGGAILLCARVGVVVDRQQRTLTTWWGLLVPFRKTEHLFSQAHVVAIYREEREFADQTYEVYPVRLEGPGTDAVTFHEPRSYDKARRLAEDIAKFVHLGIRDRSSAEEVTREAGALDQSLQQRLRRAGGSMALPGQPPQARAGFNYGGTRAPSSIEIPPVGRSLRWFLLVVFIAGFVTLFTELAMDKEDAQIGVRAVAVFVLILAFFLPLPLRSAILRERLVVSPDELVVTRRDVFGTKTTRLAAAEIEEVAVSPAKRGLYAGYAAFGGGTDRVVIRSDRASIELGAALSNPAEVKWLSDVLVHVLTCSSPCAA